MRKLWIFLIIIAVIVLIPVIGCAVSPDGFRPWFIESVSAVGNRIKEGFSSVWATARANPVYQQYHPLIWAVIWIPATLIFVYILWPKRPAIIPKTKTPQLQPMTTPTPQATYAPPPTSTTPTPEPTPLVEKKEEVAEAAA